MREPINVSGMVLSASPVGEYDKRVVILTRELGKITAFARGARRMKSPLMAVSNPFVFGEFQVYEGRDSYTLSGANIKEYFLDLAQMQPGVYYGFYFLEFTDYYTKEFNDEREMLKLLYQTLRALTNPHIPNMLIRYIFELKALTINGQAPQVFQCMTCGNKERHAVFSAVKGGLVCSECMKDVRDGMSLDPSTLYSMQYIETSTIEKLYTFNVTEKVLTELGNVMSRMTDIYVGKHFKSLEILETLI